MIEECPSPALSGDVRAKMTVAAVRAARAVGYVNAGTIEFLLDRDDNFYFMEMNTRLQVEHPVTEMVTGVDIVKWQIRIAAGVEMDFTQEDIRFGGCAIECRINAEDPADNFRPCIGRVDTLHVPNGPWVRFDSAIYQGYSIPPFYDSMIGKLIVFAKTREEAIRKMRASLCELVIEGISSNIEFQMELIESPEFKDGTYCTDFISKYGG